MSEYEFGTISRNIFAKSGDAQDLSYLSLSYRAVSEAKALIGSVVQSIQVAL
jgi:hypothetical protein